MSSPYHDVLKVVVQPAEMNENVSKEVAIEEDAVSLPPPPFKDGGLRAWLQVVGCFLVFFNVW
jgi:hypothetical protein